MKRKLVTLLVLIAALCWTTGAMAQVAYDIPLSTENVSIPDEVMQGIMDFPTADLTFDGDVLKEIVFSSNPFAEKNESNLYFCVDNHDYHYLSADDLTQNTDGQYVYTMKDDVTVESYVELRVWHEATINGTEWTYCCYYNDDSASSSDHDIEEYYYVNQYLDSATWQGIGYTYINDGGSIRAPRLDHISYNMDDVPLQSVIFDQYGILQNYSYEVEPNYHVQFNAYGDIEYANYQKLIGMSADGYEIYQFYFWNEEDGWLTWDVESDDYISLDTPEGITPVKDIVPPAVALTRPGYHIAESVSSYVLPTITPADMPDFVDVVIEGTTCTVTLTGDPFANDYSSAEGYVETGFSLSYEVGDEYYWEELDASQIHMENGSFSFEVPEGATFSYARMFSFIVDRSSSHSFELTKESQGYTGATFWDEATQRTYYYYYDDAGNVTSVDIYDGYHNYYTNYYNADGTLERYSIYVDDDYEVTYFPDGTIDLASYYVLDDTDGYYHYFYWKPETGWYTMKYDGTTDSYLNTPCDAPKGVADPTAYEAPFIAAPPKPAYSWYPNNTVGVLGLSLRDDLNLTDKWYNVVPIDLSVEGRQTVRLVASNMYYFGAAVIDVANGAVTVNYDLPDGEVYLKGECLKWFTSLDEITADFLANPQSELAFGEPVSIADDLGGAKTALLFICNHVTYRQPLNNRGDALVRYYDTNPEWVSYRAVLQTMLGQMELAQAEATTSSDISKDDAAAVEDEATESTTPSDIPEEDAAEDTTDISEDDAASAA